MDSNRSWLVAAGCCWVNIFSFAMIRSTAVVYVSIIDAFQTTREAAAWPVTLATTFYFTAALVAGILARHVSVWKITFTACLVATLAVSSCFFATTITYLALVFGVFHGFSVGHLSLSSTVINQHFTKYRAAASGLNMAGFSIAGLIFPPTVQYLFNSYGFRGAFLLAGGAMFHATAGTLLQRIPAPQKPPATMNEGAEIVREKIQDSGANEAQQRISGTYSTPACTNKQTFTTIENSAGHEKNDSKTKSPQAGGAPCQNNWKSGVENKGFEPSERCDAGNSVKNVRAIGCRGRFLSMNENASAARVIHKTRRRAMSTMEATVPIRSVFLSECLAWNENAVNNHEPFHLHVHKTRETPVKEQSDNEFSSAPDEVSASKAAQKTSMDVKSKLQKVKELFSFLALTRYYAIVLTKVVIVTNSTVFSTVIIDFAQDHGIERWRALTLISAYTAMDLTARLSAGWITDRKFLSRNTWMAFCLALWTTANFCFAYGDSYAVLLGVSAVAGWCNGSTLPLVPVLYMEVVDIGRFSVAYGLSSFTAGLTGLLRPTLTGLFRDKLGNYSGLFLLTGTCTALSTIRWICASLQEKCSRNRRKQ